MEKEVTRKENKMGTMPITRLIITMSLPAIFSMTIMAMYNIVDGIFIGQYDQDGLNATSLAYPLQMLIVAFGVGTAIGVNSLVSRKLGEHNFAQANSAATHGLITCLFSYIIFLLIGLFAVRPFMQFYTQDEKIVKFGVQYLTVVLCFSLFAIIQIMIEKTLQATGNMIFPMLFQLMGAVVNIIFDPLLIFGIGPFPELGVLGAAIATVFGQFCAMVFALIVLFFGKHEVKISFKGFRVNFSMLKNIYAVGLPSIIMQSIASVMIIGLNAVLAVYKTYVTVLGIYYKLQSFVFMPCFGLNQGVLPILGYNYGARNKKRLYSTLKRGISIAVLIMAAGTAVMWIFPEQLVALFGGSDDIISVGASAFRIISLCFIPAAVGILLTTLFQAVGKGVRGLIISFCRQLVLILPIAYLLLNFVTPSAVWFAFPIAEAGALVLALFLFFNLVRGDFKNLDK